MLPWHWNGYNHNKLGQAKGKCGLLYVRSILTVTKADMVMVAILSVVSVAALILLYHQLVYIAYDEEAAVAKVKVRLLIMFLPYL